MQSFRGRNKAISIFAGVMSAVIPFGWCISNLSAFAKLYTRMTGIPMNVLITCLAIACIAFVLPAGLKTVAWTDFIFGIVIVIGGVFCHNEEPWIWRAVFPTSLRSCPPRS